MVNSTNNQAET